MPFDTTGGLNTTGGFNATGGFNEPKTNSLPSLNFSIAANSQYWFLLFLI